MIFASSRNRSNSQTFPWGFAAQFAHRRAVSAAWRNTVRFSNSFRFTNPPKGFTTLGRMFRVIQYQWDRALRAAASVSVSSRFWDPGWLAQGIARRARQALLGTVGLARLGLGFRVRV